MMERLTFDGNFCDIAQCTEIPGGSFCEDGACSQKKVRERLKAYEDMGLTPERCAELAEADKGERLLVLPCKVGDTVWFVLHDSPWFYPETSGWYIGESKVNTVTNEGFCDGEVDVDGITPWGELGKTVFLTREEAEAALRR